MKRLENKVAIVTGANSGIARPLPSVLLRKAPLWYCAPAAMSCWRRPPRVQNLWVEALAVKADLTIHADCTHVVEETIKNFGRVDILVNNAGIADKHRPITECTDEWWDEVIAIDQTSLFYLTKDVLPHMGEGSSIVNVSSIGGVFGSAAFPTPLQRPAFWALPRMWRSSLQERESAAMPYAPALPPPPSTHRSRWLSLPPGSLTSVRSIWIFLCRRPMCGSANAICSLPAMSLRQ